MNNSFQHINGQKGKYMNSYGAQAGPSGGGNGGAPDPLDLPIGGGVVGSTSDANNRSIWSDNTTGKPFASKAISPGVPAASSPSSSSCSCFIGVNASGPTWPPKLKRANASRIALASSGVAYKTVDFECVQTLFVTLRTRPCSIYLNTSAWLSKLSCICLK